MFSLMISLSPSDEEVVRSFSCNQNSLINIADQSTSPNTFQTQQPKEETCSDFNSKNNCSHQSWRGKVINDSVGGKSEN